MIADALAWLAVGLLVLALNEIRRKREERDRYEWLRYRAERRGVLL